jgi:membrane peptidoglycan carboxypeptidase
MNILHILGESLLNLFKYIYSKRHSILRSLFYFITIATTILIASAYVVWKNEKTFVKANLDKYKSEVSNYHDSIGSKPIRIFDKNEKLIGEFYRKNFKPIRTDNLKDYKVLVWALLSSEDRDFYKHGGINYYSILRALVINLSKFKLTQGGSTITQQLAKLTLNLGERNIYNKITEAFCTYYIENQYDKETILAMYMNQIFLGEGNIGLEEASRYYFNKSGVDLNPAEAALLVGIIPAPSVYNPVKNLNISLERQKRILNDMSVNLQLYSDKPEKDFAKKLNENIRIFKNTYKIKENKVGEKVVYISEIGKYGFDRDFKINLAPDFNESIRRIILDKFSNEVLERTSLNVYTTLDYDKQVILQQALRDSIESVRTELSKEKEVYNKKNLPKEVKRQNEIIDSMNGSAISIDPFTGNVEALIGAYKISSVFRLNRAEEIRRQPGSVIKGLVYALALEKNIINPSTLIKDEKVDFKGYSPKNWYGNYKGYITARYALAQSVNTVAVKLLSEIGVGYFTDKLSAILDLSKEELRDRFGNNLSLALGSGELSPLELTLIYSTIANGGYRVSPRKILKITDEENNDKTPMELIQTKETVSIIDPVACAMAVNLLESVVSGEGTLPARFKEKIPLAGKTGTVQTPSAVKAKWANRKGVRDSWFSGIYPSNVTTVWIGNDQGAPFPGSGAGLSGQVWLKFIGYMKSKKGIEGEIVKPFEGNFVRVDTCGETGELLSESVDCKFPLYGQYYYAGTQPVAQQKAPEIKVEDLIKDTSQDAVEGAAFENEKDKYNKMNPISEQDGKLIEEYDE